MFERDRQSKLIGLVGLVIVARSTIVAVVLLRDGVGAVDRSRRAAFRGHVRALRDIVGSWDETPSVPAQASPPGSAERQSTPVQVSFGKIPTR